MSTFTLLSPAEIAEIKAEILELTQEAPKTSAHKKCFVFQALVNFKTLASFAAAIRDTPLVNPEILQRDFGNNYPRTLHETIIFAVNENFTSFVVAYEGMTEVQACMAELIALFTGCFDAVRHLDDPNKKNILEANTRTISDICRRCENVFSNIYDALEKNELLSLCYCSLESRKQELEDQLKEQPKRIDEAVNYVAKFTQTRTSYSSDQSNKEIQEKYSQMQLELAKLKAHIAKINMETENLQFILNNFPKVMNQLSLARINCLETPNFFEQIKICFKWRIRDFLHCIQSMEHDKSLLLDKHFIAHTVKIYGTILEVLNWVIVQRDIWKKYVLTQREEIERNTKMKTKEAQARFTQQIEETDSTTFKTEFTEYLAAKKTQLQFNSEAQWNLFINGLQQ